MPPHMNADDVQALLAARHDAPFDVLGLHKVGGKSWLVALVPDAETLSARFGRKTVEIPRLDGPIFAGPVPNSKLGYTLNATYPGGDDWAFDDPYRFGPVLGDMDRHLIGEGTHRRLWQALGAHVTKHEGVPGTHFAVWAPNAAHVSLVGDFNVWDGHRNPMRRVGQTGCWEIFMPGMAEGTLYKYEIAPQHGAAFQKADPVAFGAQHPPATASVVRDISGYGWTDDAWMQARAERNRRDRPISIYEVHLGSWRRAADGRMLSYRELATQLVDYATYMGFTHLEFLPVSEFPFDGSWGYQPVGMYAPTIRFGPPHEFRDLVEAAHNAGLGVLLDWVPGHFPTDAHGLAQFDGTALYEHEDPREGFHHDWNTLIYNYGRTEVRNFLTANAVYWLSEYHVDGLRVDAVASMLYRDYSRPHDQWVPNKDGGRENYEAIAFLREMNTVAYGEVPGIMTVAEESTAFPGVSTPVDAGGLGFGFKWNMGWMNDTLRYMEKDPVHRSWEHHLITFPIDWAWTENFILPISHDEVVHGKGSMIDKMPGNEWEKFANLRAYYGYMWGFPGKKLLFMGCEFAQWQEWNHDVSLDWDALRGHSQRGVQALVRDLNHLYRETPALHVNDCDPAGFRWIMNDPQRSLTAFARFGGPGDAPVIVVCNFTPMEWHDVRLGVPGGDGSWSEVLNTDAETYGGGNRINAGGVTTEEEGCHGLDRSIRITVPPLSTVMFRRDP
ncbi:1,4-alpha-glucan branching protein GlgB [Thetidibacter halocola]|uniref:1,4-alpha-glucan branching enzyme GlgB n=1 Tax=Thetidibacter halocola TaxID=2827239 RepID=A0A8J8B775_9RHOB|nr:1,4-alpha-glucan branching protein GlgB [Thetidibacter halocola]MBS0123255.1 1,4-alpha-glucan branching protein GlgB [Thetidibacter halocola]